MSQVTIVQNLHTRDAPVPAFRPMKIPAAEADQALQWPTLVLQRNRFGYANNEGVSRHARTPAPCSAESDEERVRALLQL